MNWIRKSYLYQLYHYQKWMFWIVVFFVLGTLFFTFRGNQTTPFWVWGMYSEKISSKDSGTAILMFNQAGENIPIYSQRGFKTRFYLHSPLEFYHQSQLLNADPRKTFWENKAPGLIHFLPSNAFSSQLDNYGDWLKRYLNQSSKDSIETIYILQYRYKLNPNNELIYQKDSLYVF